MSEDEKKGEVVKVCEDKGDLEGANGFGEVVEVVEGEAEVCPVQQRARLLKERPRDRSTQRRLVEGEGATKVGNEGASFTRVDCK